MPSISKALAVMRSARVESSPPEIPTTALLAPVWARRFFKPMAWIVKISSQRAVLSFSFDGTKGAGSI